MVRTNPQWLRARELVGSGRIGQLRSVTGYFSYFNRDANNIRNKYEIGGGGLMDIGCYPITTSRFLFGEEPRRVVSLIERDPEMKVDRLASVILDFPSGQAIFSCSTQLVAYQRMNILGTKGRIEIEIPFNAPNDRPCRIFIDDGGDLTGKTISTEAFPVRNQYTIQGDLFSRAIREGLEVPVPVTDAIKNMHFTPLMVSVIVSYFTTAAPVITIVTGADPFAPELLADRRAAVLDFITSALFVPETSRKDRLSSAELPAPSTATSTEKGERK